ncbi:DUF1445 domain protein [Aspergillus nomiae NRRL 13137]|uniref:DUF1445 domain protein n=1 Tax=Aspergillus nomiae NRRL (strain ATCC 15546 / NRRL 13137 / CBS 260.88 / M93) TaxID=1509407 RepID=A0A0L1JIH1_ASPN3|nr:DUF1445 domain protein [Aspergillus nomiae NRRL 13137]KNG91559.1 DUF1445 domain protein [Aspergillus nomiae NRRL 13137]
MDPTHCQTAHQIRLLGRQNHITNTSGLAPGYLQANLLILPSKHAEDFHNLCLRNPVSCPLLGLTPKGNPNTVYPSSCIKYDDFDLRTDCPKYRVYKDGKYIESRTDLLNLWTDDYVGFLIGCSFSFEDALADVGLKPRHQATGTIVAMYKTRIPLLASGIFKNGTCIVSMRPYRVEDVERVREITRPFLATHGEPVDWGWDALERLGISDIEKPDFGERQAFEEGEVPVFWVRFSFLPLPFSFSYEMTLLIVHQACGVTPQMAVESAGDRIEGLVFAHEPAHMLVTDFTVKDLERLGKPLYN